MKKKNEIAEFLVYMITELGIPVLQHRRLPNLVEAGDKLNITAQPFPSQLKKLEEKIETEEQLSRFIRLKEQFEGLLLSNPSEYSFYELLDKGYFGFIDSNQPVELKQEKYHALIKKVEHTNFLQIATVDVLSPLEIGTHVNYTKKPAEKLDDKLNEKLNDKLEGDNNPAYTISFCEAITPNGERIRYEVGEKYVFSFTGTTQTGNKHVSYDTSQITPNGKKIFIKVVYRARPKLSAIEHLEVKVSKIISEEKQVRIKLFPVSDKIY